MRFSAQIFWYRRYRQGIIRNFLNESATIKHLPVLSYHKETAPYQDNMPNLGAVYKTSGLSSRDYTLTTISPEPVQMLKNVENR